MTTTAIDSTQIVKLKNTADSEIIKILFLGRIQNLKGIEELIETIGLLKQMVN